ncbi:MAG TPA: response regulator, partial [Chroococcales cyanobacterium]
IGVESKVGEGSTFWFTLPLDPTSRVDFGSEGVKILVVESDNYWAEVLNRVFSDGPFDVIYVNNTSAADDVLKQSRPDLIVLDFQSADGDRLEFLERLKHNQATLSIPVVALSSRDREEGGGEAQGLLIDWLPKPFEAKQLKKAVNSAIRRRTPGPIRVLIVEDDPATREVIREHISELDIQCLEASDGLEGVEIARSQNPDLMILDLGLPRLDGFEVIKILREDKSRLMPVIVYTNRDLTRDDKNRLTLGLTNYLVKSRTTDDDLIASVKELLNGLLAHRHERQGESA